MSPLRKLLKHPATYLALLGLLAGSVYADSFRPPDRQLAARAYISLVRGYQGWAARCWPVWCNADIVLPALATR